MGAVGAVGAARAVWAVRDRHGGSRSRDGRGGCRGAVGADGAVVDGGGGRAGGGSSGSGSGGGRSADRDDLAGGGRGGGVAPLPALAAGRVEVVSVVEAAVRGDDGVDGWRDGEGGRAEVGAPHHGGQGGVLLVGEVVAVGTGPAHKEYAKKRVADR